MALLNPIGKIQWKGSVSKDVIAYRVFWSFTGNTPSDHIAKNVDYSSSYIDVTEPPQPGEKYWSVTLPLVGMNLGSIPSAIQAVKVGLASMDSAGNLSDIVQIAIDATPYKAVTDYDAPDDITDPEYYVYL